MVTEASPRPSRGRRVGSRIVISVASVLVAMTVCGFLVGWWVFDVMASLRPQLGLLLIVAAGVLVVLGPRWAAVPAAAAAAVNVVLVVPLLIGSGPAAVTPGMATLDITFLNLKIRAADPDALIAYLQERDDDLVILAAGSRSWVDALETADLGMTVVQGPREGIGVELIVLSRDPDVDTVLHFSGRRSRTALIEVTVNLAGEPVRVLGTHPVSPLTPARAEQRDVQLAWIADWAEHAQDPVVVVGDLNATPWSPAFRSLLDDGDLMDSQRVHGVQASWPAPWGPLGLALDHVLHSSDITVVDRRLGPSFGSDHRAVHARIAHAGAPS